MSEPIPIGTVVNPYGQITAVMLTGGERYYFLLKGGGVSLMPASVIEPKEPDHDPR